MHTIQGGKVMSLLRAAVLAMVLLFSSVSASGGEDMDALIAKFKAKQYYKGDVDKDSFQKLVDSGVTIIDIRRDDEVEEMGMIPGSINLTFFNKDGEPDERFLNSLTTIVKSKDEPILIVCRRGVRSKFAAQWLAYKGFTNVYNQEHGVKELIKYRKTKMVDRMY